MGRKRRTRDDLSAEKERALLVRWRRLGDERAMQRVIEAYRPFAIKMAMQYRGGLSRESREDFIQEAMVGLLEAAKRFDPDKPVRFSTYARHWIVAQLQAAAFASVSMVKLPTDCKARQAYAMTRRMQARGEVDQSGRLSDEAVAKLAAKFNIGVERARAIEALSLAPAVPLDAPPAGYNNSRIDQLVDELAAIPGESMDDEARSEALHRAVYRLRPREQRVIALRHLTEDKPATLEMIGAEFGLSKERVRQIEATAFRKLRTALAAEGVA